MAKFFLKFLYVQTWCMQSTPETEKMRLSKVKLVISLCDRTSILHIVSKIICITYTEINYQETTNINNFFSFGLYFVVWTYQVLSHDTFSILFSSEAMGMRVTYSFFISPLPNIQYLLHK